jgi:hypothetical protein
MFIPLFRTTPEHIAMPIAEPTTGGTAGLNYHPAMHSPHLLAFGENCGKLAHR